MKIKMFFTATLFLFFIGLNAQTKDKSTNPSQEKREIKSPVGTYDRNDNGVNPQKRDKIKSINQQFRTDMQVIQSSDLTPEAKKEKITKLQESRKAEMDKILTPEEREKLKQGKAKHHKANKDKKSKAKHQKGNNKYKDLNLDDNQKKAIRDIEKNHKDQVKQIRKNTALTPDEKKERLMAERSNRKNQIKQHLNQEQIRKMEKKSKSKKSDK